MKKSAAMYEAFTKINGYFSIRSRRHLDTPIDERKAMVERSSLRCNKSLILPLIRVA